MTKSESNILHRVIGETLPSIVAGSGIYLQDTSGKRYIDASGGAAVACLGHGHPRVLDAIRDQISAVCYVHSGSFTTPVVEQLGHVLAEGAPQEINHTYLVSGGSEAVESAVKLARQYHIESGEPKRRHVIARRQSYHGNTLGALSVSGHPARRRPYEPILLPFHHVDPCYSYRFALPDESLADYARRTARALEIKINQLGAENVAAFVAETVVGATLGAVAAEAGYFRHIRDICDRYGVLLILDEVMSGMGRTGCLHAFEAEGIVPDMVTLAKGLAGGYQPIGAVLIADRVRDALAAGSGTLQHGLTYSGHPVAAVAALAVQNVITEENLLNNVRAMGRRLHAGLQAQLGEHPFVGDIRGRGLLQAIELVADRDSKIPFDPSRQIHDRINKATMELGMMVYPSAGCMDGISGDHVLMAPPFNSTPGEIDEIVGRLCLSLDKVFAGKQATGC